MEIWKFVGMKACRDGRYEGHADTWRRGGWRTETRKLPRWKFNTFVVKVVHCMLHCILKVVEVVPNICCVLGMLEASGG